MIAPLAMAGAAEAWMMQGMALHAVAAIGTVLGFEVQVNQSCLLLVERKANGVRLSASRPDTVKPNALLEIEANCRLEGDGCSWPAERNSTRLRIPLHCGKAGELAGKSVIVDLKMLEGR